MRLQVLSKSGAVVQRISMPSSGLVAQHTPNGFFGVAADWRGRVYCSAPDQAVVWCFSGPHLQTQGKLGAVDGQLVFPAGLDVGEGWRLLAIADQKAYAIFLLDISSDTPSDTRLLRTVLLQQSPYSVAFDRRGSSQMVVSCLDSGAILKLSRKGDITTLGNIPGARTVCLTEQGLLLLSTTQSSSKTIQNKSSSKTIQNNSSSKAMQNQSSSRATPNQSG